MSVNINVNGKFSKESSYSLLEDPERRKKQIEKQRRTQRLQQVRAQSKEFARKLRSDVAKEKERQLKKLESVRNQELKCWREHVLAKKTHDYQKSILQIGSAHYAAKAENIAKKKTENAPSTSKTTSKKTKVFKKSDVNRVVAESESSDQPKFHKEIHTLKVNENSNKRLQVCFDEKLEQCSCTSVNETDDDETDFTCSSITSSSCEIIKKDNKDTQTENGTAAKSANVDSEFREHFVPIVQKNAVDKIVQTNSNLSNSIIVSSKATASTQTAIIDTTESLLEEIKPSSKPRFTQISDLIAKQQQRKASEEIAHATSEPTIAVAATNPTRSPKKAPSANKSMSSPKLKSRSSSPTKSNKSLEKSSLGRRSSTMKSTAATSAVPSDSSSKVQFFDYKNKYAKEYTQPVDAVTIMHVNSEEPNAMERAAAEILYQKDRELEMEKLRQIGNERSELALKREKVRRECTELTEKLEALGRQGQNFLPSDADLHSHQYFATKTARKESKLNNAIEELLSRPAVITCAEVQGNEQPQTSGGNKTKCSVYLDSNDVNLGRQRLRRNSDPTSIKSSDTDSCGSILLGYIEDQRDHIRQEISQCESSPKTNRDKMTKLLLLLERIENLRESLIKELEKNTNEEQRVDKTTQLPGSSSDLKRSSSELKRNKSSKRLTTTEQIAEQDSKSQQVQKVEPPNEANEKAGLRKSVSNTVAAAEVKIVTSKNQVIEHTKPGKPFEIVIKLKSDKKSGKKSSKTKILEKFIKSKIETESRKDIRFTAIEKEQPRKEASVIRRNSYDSNSTAYQSMPPALTNAADDFVNRISQMKFAKESSLNKALETTKPLQSSSSVPAESSNNSNTQAVLEQPQRRRKPHLNPLIAQYVQRLLGMSRNSVMALDVSSSEIETPSSSIVNITANMGHSSAESLLISEDHVQKVERFINENRSFINELEESLKTHSNTSLETSMRRFEEIWRQKFKSNTNLQEHKEQKVEKIENVEQTKNQMNMRFLKGSKTKTKTKTKKIATESDQQRQVQGQVQQVPLSSEKEKAKVEEAVTSKNKQKIEASKIVVDNVPGADYYEHSESQLKHYAELTKNCSNRIAELTALITKVRAEKQRLLEVTLTSGSENGRNSTEYAELPTMENVVENAEIETAKLSDATSSDNVQSQNDEANATLEKYKKTGRSRDSGISMPSRPVTALGNEYEIEPQSLASSVQTTTTITTNSVRRKARPPPSIATQHRYSPQNIDDEIVHELSTIVEVDTPATSRLNTSAQQSQPPLQETQSSENKKEARRFPTFKEYVKELNLDLSEFAPERSMQMEHEYNDLIEALKEGQGDKVCNYDVFPTLTSYIQNLTTNDSSCLSPETFESLFACLRLAPITVKPFPSHREYISKKTPNSTQRNIIDTDSLENISNGTNNSNGTISILSGSESETLNIEEELKRRNILKGSFRSMSTQRQDVSILSTSSGKKREQTNSAKTTTVDMDGIERLNTTTTDSASEKFHQELLALGIQWPKTMRDREKELAALSSSSTSELTASIHRPKRTAKNSKQHNQSKDKNNILSDSESSERPLNLRDFLTRQLLKHAATTSSNDSSLSGDSLRSEFFLAVLDSMTPSSSPRVTTNTGTRSNGQTNLERQKTSTPVQSVLSALSIHHTNSTQLFSNESHLSAVHQQTNDFSRKAKKDKTQQ